MPTEPPNLVVFRKLMQMTLSDNDAECLNAIRMANALLSRVNMNWEDLLAGKVKMINADPFVDLPTPPSSTKHHDDADEINAYFDTLLSRHLGSFKTYVDSVHEWWEEKGFLTEKQYNVIRNAAKRR